MIWLTLYGCIAFIACLATVFLIEAIETDGEVVHFPVTLALFIGLVWPAFLLFIVWCLVSKLIDRNY